MILRVDPSGRVEALYAEAIDLAALGELTIRRAGHVEPDFGGGWFADLSPLGGPTLGPFPRRSTALAAEQAWIDRHRFGGPP
jgi:hypothetical protein